MKNLTLFILLSLFSFHLLAQGIGIVDGSSASYLHVLETHTEVNVQNQIARVTSRQVLKNTTGQPVNIKYGFPLVEQANPIDMRWQYGGVWATASISASEQDNSIPGGGGSGYLDPNLTNYLGEFPFFFSPNDTIANDSVVVMELTYVQLLPYFLGKVDFYQKNNYSALQTVTPLVQSFEFNLLSERVINSVELLDEEATLDLSDHEATLSYMADEQAADFDFRVQYELSSEGLGINSLSTFIPDTVFNCDEHGQGHFTFIVEPESNVDTEVIEKNFSLVIDRSGSMDGNKIIQAKDAATFIIQNLNEGDFFNIVDFNSYVTSFSSEFLPYNIENETAALSYVSDIYAGGGTNISDALITSIDQFGVVEQDKANIIIFLTDGHATAGITNRQGILDAVQNQIAASETEVFLFALGIGEGADEALLTLLARQNNGLVDFLDPATLEEELVRFFLSVNNPVLLNTDITFTPDIIKEIYPYPYPNLYKGQQLILSGRYDEAQDITVHLEGRAFNVPVSYDFEVSLADTNIVDLSFLPKVWAKQKLDVLGLDFYLASTEATQDSISNAIDSISICYGVIDTDFSSFDDNSGGGVVETEELVFEEAAEHILISPTTCVDYINIHFKDAALIGEDALLSIYNVSGQKVLQASYRISSDYLTIKDLAALDPGVYIVSVLIDSVQYTAKFVKS